VTNDKKTTATIPFWIAAACVVFLCAALATSVISGPLPVSGSPAGIPGALPGPAVTLPACPPDLARLQETPIAPEPLAESTIILTRPPEDDRIPYTERGFTEPVEAAIAWWMSPGFMDNTTEFRGYERKTPEGKLAYPEEHRIFFTFIQDQLDTAEQQSVLKSDHLLFRGISPSVAGTVLNTSRYHEPAFASTSYDISFSLDAFGVRSPDGYRNMLVLERESGDHALYINEDEREYLLPRGSDWTVTRTANVENLTVTADFPLHNRETGTAFFDHVRLITIQPATCV
jgi:hypothetical protein